FSDVFWITQLIETWAYSVCEKLAVSSSHRGRVCSGIKRESAAQAEALAKFEWWKTLRDFSPPYLSTVRHHPYQVLFFYNCTALTTTQLVCSVRLQSMVTAFWAVVTLSHHNLPTKDN